MYNVHFIPSMIGNSALLPLRVPANLRKPFYCSIIQNGSQVEWDVLLERYIKDNSPAETKTLIQGLACSTDVVILNK